MNKFIHQAIVVYLSMIILLRMMAMPLSLIDFSLNQRFIAQNLCENRLNTAIHCSGKCYLNKKLAKTTENPESQNQKGSFKILIVDFCESNDRTVFFKSNVKQVFNICYLQGIISGNTSNIFHPPIASSRTV